MATETPTPTTGSIRATTPTERASPTEGPILTRNVASLVVALALGLALVWLSAPRFLGALDALPARNVLWEIRKERPVSAELIARGATALERSRRWSGTPAHLLSDLALLKLLQSQLAVDVPTVDAERLLAESVEAQQASLAKAPAGSNGWARLAYARYELAGLTPGARDALEMSLLTGGIDLPLLSFRLYLMLREWDTLESPFEDAAHREIIGLTRHGRPGYEALVDIYLSSGHGEVIDAVLTETPRKHAQFTRQLQARLGLR